MTSPTSKDQGASKGNFGVDYVIHYRVPLQERAAAEAGFVQLIQALARVGLATSVRQGQGQSLLIFVKVASPTTLDQQVYRSRLHDWLHGARTSSPDDDVSRSLTREPVSEAEHLRIVYQLMTLPQSQGGAGVTASHNRFDFVNAVFPLHDAAFNKAWIQRWGKKYLLDDADLDEIRNKFGEQIAFYFCFLRNYFRFLVFPAALGLFAWLFLGQFSYLYALGCGLWSVVFLEYWKQKELDLAVQWGVRGVSAIQHPRSQFKWDYEAVDEVTGETKRIYPFTKRLQTQLLQIPFALACIIALGGLVVVCNSLEIFINEVYSGPFKQYLGFLPTVLLVVFTPTLSAVLMRAATALTDRENYETTDAYHAALVQKQFVLNFMTSYMALLFTAFVYIPFGNLLTPLLNFWSSTAQFVSFSEKPLATQTFKINPERISSQMFYFTVTAQIVNFATEVVVPYFLHKASSKAQEFQGKGIAHAQDAPEEAEFLKRVRNECQLEVYDVTDDYREMIMQFGYLALFSVAWPLAASCFLVNNWVELRSDALKIAISCKRPIPWRSDSIGPWLTALGMLSWLGSITSAAIVYLCRGSAKGGMASTSPITAWGCLLSILLAEHFYLLVQKAVRHVMSKMESKGVQQERKERYLMKKRLLQDKLSQQVKIPAAAPQGVSPEDITREILEDEARRASIQGQGSPEDIFWQRQRGMDDSIVIGRTLIEQCASETKNPQGPKPSPRA